MPHYSFLVAAIALMVLCPILFDLGNAKISDALSGLIVMALGILCGILSFACVCIEIGLLISGGY